MRPFPVKVRYRYGEGGKSRDASFYGLRYDRSDRALLDRLRELHRFASGVEIVEVRWRHEPSEAPTGPPGRGADRRLLDGANTLPSVAAERLAARLASAGAARIGDDDNGHWAG